MSWLRRPLQLLSRRHLPPTSQLLQVQPSAHTTRFTSSWAQNPKPPTNPKTKDPNPQPQTTPTPSETETFLKSTPRFRTLATDPSYTLTRPHLSITSSLRQNHLVAGPLSGPGKITVPPYVFTSKSDRRVVTLFHAGRQVSGHPGFMQGGLMAVMFDEAFAKAVSMVLPSGVGMTVSMAVDFRRPARLESGYVMEVWVERAEGRKGWVRGVLRGVSLDNDEGDVVSEAKALFVEPRFAESMVPLYKH